ncbi:hypothetical protein ABZX98_02435 [Streptomyces sp. NPDC002992]|uniref:hypothetical protein n=1 Tax=Streptomyces sp. NPDC002992 TaxID=3154273 RepID=UPI0033B5191C
MSIEPTDFVARLRAEQEDPERKDALRRERAQRPRRAVFAGIAGALVLGGIGAWLVGGTPWERQPVDEGPPTVAAPFRGSPAASWADGAAGIELPEARAVNGMTRNQVADALNKAKEFLVAANLDPATLRGEKTPPALYMLDSFEGIRDEIQDSLNRPSKDRDPLCLFTRFDPAEVRLAGSVIKTRGRMTFESPRPGEVLVHAEYSFVYPLVRVGPGADRVTRVVMDREITFGVYDAWEYETIPGSLVPVQYRYAGFNVPRDDADGFLRPGFGGEGLTPGRGVDPYDLDRKLADLPAGDFTISRV